MSAYPLPARMVSLYEGQSDPGFTGSASMVLARGVDTWTSWSPKAELDKGLFLQRFAERHCRTEDFTPWLDRRRQALEDLGATTVTHTTESRLVVGLGLPHPTETGFLLDRLTGSPYLPGSTVKGLLRATAREAVREEWAPLAEDRSFWQEHLTTVFGATASASEDAAARGACAFYDAFPEHWPQLEVDILTPHYSPYYMKGEIPGDWEPPVPVPFLTVATSTRFGFPLRPLPHKELDPEELVHRLHRLLAVALSWLGVGGKTQAGYGFFEEVTPPAPAASLEETWPKAYVYLDKGPGLYVAVSADKRKAEVPKAIFEKMAPEALINRLKKKPYVTVRVRPRDGGGLEIVSVETD